MPELRGPELRTDGRIAIVGVVHRPGSKERAMLDELVEAATVDCYDESECVTGFLTLLDDHLATPFTTSVLGVDVTVAAVTLSDDDRIVAICTRDGVRQRVPLLDLPLPEPRPGGAEWIDAYRLWAKGIAR